MRSMGIVYAVAVVCLFLLVLNAQPPPPTPSDPFEFTGGIISETDDESCDNIYTDVDSVGGTDGGKLQCNKASVIVLQVPLVQTPATGGAFVYQFTPNGQSGGGQYVTNPALCAEKGPGYCLYGRPFEIRVTVSPVVTAFDLQEIGIAAPFGYLYENCLSKAPANGATVPPYYTEASCGTADITDDTDYRDCESTFGFPYFYNGAKDDRLAPLYSKCLFMCGWEIAKQKQILGSASFDDWCNDRSLNNVINVTESFLQPSTVRNQLGCARADKYDAAAQKQMPNFPLPTGFCPCANSETDVILRDKDGIVPTPPPSPRASIIACKTCAGAGSCGSALPVPRPTKPSDCHPGLTNEDQDTVCLCDDTFSTGSTESPAEAVNDPHTVCFNTNQNHRCLKCQFDTITRKGDGTPTGSDAQECAYTDMNKYAFCESYWPDICGAGNMGVGQQLLEDPNNRAAVGLCNCQGIFIERSYWVAPMCSPYRILNPARPQYAITVELIPTDIAGESGVVVPGGTMTVGAGWAPWASDAERELQLSWINGTVDGFAVTEILSEYTKSGGYSSNLHGNIVMCNSATQSNSFCSMTSTNDTASTKLPSADIFTAPDVQGVVNPWSVAFLPNSTVPLVPLPDFLYKALGYGNASLGLEQDELERNAKTWWFYLSQNEQDTYGLACGQNGWTMRGAADTATTTSMCAGPQGTCVPGIDRRLRGEAVKPPCTVAVDFLNYVVGDSAGVPLSEQGSAPQHVPFDWDAAAPQYYVHRGQLRWTGDPLVQNGNMNVRLRISVAADFNGVESAQSSGTVEAEQCYVSSSSSTGIFQVKATNQGSVTSEFVFSQGPECSPSLEIPDYVVSLSAGAPTIVNVPIQGNALYTGAAVANAFCSVTIAPSLLKGTNVVTGTTAQTPCTNQFSPAVIIPYLSANVTYTEAVFDTAFANFHNDPDCSGWLCGYANGWKHGGYLSAAMIWIESLVFTAMLTMLMALVMIIIGKRLNEVMEYRIGMSQGLAEDIRRLKVDTIAD